MTVSVTRVPLEVDPRTHGLVTDGTTDNATALTNALAEASDAGGGTVHLPSGRIAWSGTVSVPDGVSLVGCGSAKSVDGTTLVALSSGSKIAFGGQAVTRYAGIARDFAIDGNALATNPLYIGRSVNRSFYDIYVSDAASGDAGIRVEEAQNCVFVNVWAEANRGHGIIFDRGCGGNAFFRCEFSGNGITSGYNMEFTQSAATSGVLYDVPTHNAFYHCIAEHRGAGTSGMIHHGAGHNNSFYSCVISDVDATSAATLFKFEQSTAYTSNHVHFNNCIFFGNTTYITGLDVAANLSAFLDDNTQFVNCLNAFKVGAGSSVFVGYIYLNNCTNRIAAASGGTDNNQIRMHTLSPIQISRLTTGDNAILSYVEGDSGIRFQLFANGLMQFMDGTSFTGDTNLYRSAADTLRTDDKFITGGEANIVGALNHDGSTVGFYGVSPTTRPTALTAANGSALNTGDATSDTVIGNMRTRIGEIETKLQALGLLS